MSGAATVAAAHAHLEAARASGAPSDVVRAAREALMEAYRTASDTAWCDGIPRAGVSTRL